MENNFIQMAVSAGHAVAYTIGPILKYIIDCVELYFTNGFTNIEAIVSGLSAKNRAQNIESCWNQMLAISSSSIFVNKNLFNIAR